ncbi:hypothetical protein VPNG_07059 [Cytospora leucostoma]|uniref:Alpha/beta hydrolase fold-3 domain-containing protein n=1 Tax=Cytospora leucostoma TaxID=1230097 RepID=A0A423WVQ9_9PEZI|nr:hypothetical protein VPNG_07059 [Cytospora leucostoma]
MAAQDHIVNPIDASVVDKVAPEFAQIYNTYQASKLRADQVPYEEYNKDRAKYTFPTYKVSGPCPDVGSSVVYTIPVTEPTGEISVEVVHPTAEAISAGGLQNDDRLPAYLDFHGGGFVIGNLDTDRVFCRNVAQSVGCIVVNVEYRTSPEYPHPTPIMDSFDALKWVVKEADSLGIDASRLAVGGFSAGGCIAAALAVMARDDPTIPPLRHQLLIVPVLDARYVPEEGSCDPKTVPYESYVSFEFAPCLPLQRLRWFYNLWLGRGAERVERANDFRASPIVAKDLSNLAPASIHSAAIDPLVDEGKAYHEKLTAAGTPSVLKVYGGVGHPFGHWVAELPAATELAQTAHSALRQAFTI